MPAPTNAFKQRLKSGSAQIGLWVALANPYSAEVVAGLGFEWLLLDGEHAPNDVPLLLSQLQAVATSSSHPVVRLPIGETWLIKQVLDIGAQTLLIPMVEGAEQARELVRATRYPPHGIRGVGAALARASGFNRVTDYLPTANDEICLLLQIETLKGLAAIEEIAAVEGVDGLFIGPSDLAADMGHLGNPAYRDVRAAVEDGLNRIKATGRASGTLATTFDFADAVLGLGTDFVAVGTDVSLLMRGGADLLRRFKQDGKEPGKSGGY
ncbi:4-hydroxy-2-oxoheptanedioate aldolase [Aurantimonas sp. VKM B-3413]|uniref:4-hydroxy-2-oxoheptanedioate aldolase n=1 Tax=Aurantimonas sp. VKM B-3413 TaxID=2779401 RepID=UPI001E318743|nr:4-hydroxy-2-oxoheptanedioate aldolase [Aurantimonas sp. VKM B-3413]MCB8836274.1 4-hydroxy-2-oxoheptanedioate aldolase [Aurantimonas sp. VKM B-3413]